MAMAVDGAPGVGDPFLRRACELAFRLDYKLRQAVPYSGTRNDAAANGVQSIWINLVTVVRDALERRLYHGRPYDRRDARQMALDIAQVCSELPKRRLARDRVLARDARRDALLGGRDRAMYRARDLALAFAENLQQPWRPAYLLELLARLLPPAERERFVEEHNASLAHASSGERWVYLLDLLAAVPTTAWALRAALLDRSLGVLPVASTQDEHPNAVDAVTSTTTSRTGSRGLASRLRTESWLAVLANDEKSTGPTRPMPPAGLAHGVQL
jgi:hypothetical protein